MTGYPLSLIQLRFAAFLEELLLQVFDANDSHYLWFGLLRLRSHWLFSGCSGLETGRALQSIDNHS
jgi:hypothetical protein